MALTTISPQPRIIQIDLEGGLASHKGQVLARPCDLREAAWCAENLADSIASTNEFLEAVHFQEKARDHWLDWAKDNSQDKVEWPAILKWGMGTNLIWAGRNSHSRDILTQGLRQLESAKTTNYSLGTVDRADGDFKSAERHFTEAYNKWISGDNLLSDPFCGACVYRIGCATLDQGKLETAIKHLREASVITERHKVRMPVERARSLFKLSEGLAKDPRGYEELRRLSEESTRLLLSRSPQAKATNLEKTYDDLIFIWLQ
ncbi:Tetratricopeptide-like helical [Penicillium italicum]|uniref:Tetratricopeptide-like helical n=1 Tax=Penicillium italicum TaxID=40296 RepID=A0A0A2KAY0_PENIT|nr:Tetratricopeptide-like helical [Penicillium italicum]